jgi:small subunit ribosomal protein S6
VKRPYETVVVFDGTLPDDLLHKEQKQLEDLLKQNAVFDKTEIWGKRQLAYPVKKKRTGYYCMFLFEAEGDIAATIDKYAKLNNSILRHLTVVRNLKNDKARAAVFARRERPVETETVKAAKAVGDKEEESEK